MAVRIAFHEISDVIPRRINVIFIEIVIPSSFIKEYFVQLNYAKLTLVLLLYKKICGEF